jgi:hypothetical protein
VPLIKLSADEYVRNSKRYRATLRQVG